MSGTVVNDLLGKSFRVNDLDYVIVDVIAVRGDWMVYAETRQPVRTSRRAAFHLSDLTRMAGFGRDVRTA